MSTRYLFFLFFMVLAGCKADKKTEQKKWISYHIGYELGHALNAEKIAVNTAQITQGLEDALTHHARQNPQETQNFITDFFKEKNQNITKIKLENEKNGRRYLAKYDKKSHVFNTPSGLRYRIIKKGKGPLPNLTDKVFIRYKGQLINGHVFDQITATEPPLKVGLDELIAGISEALRLMPVGSYWELVLPPAIAYGANSRLAKIPPGSTLIMQVDLVGIAKED